MSSSLAKTKPFGNNLRAVWAELTKSIPLSKIHTRQQYDAVVKAMEYLADMVDDDSGHPLLGLLEVLEVLVDDYDRVYHQIPSITGIELLRNIMTEQGLRQADLSEIGSQGVVSEILSGKRRLNKRQAGILAKRFSLPENLFLSS